MEAASLLPFDGRPDELRHDHDKSTLLMARVIVTANCSRAGARTKSRTAPASLCSLLWVRT